MLRSQHCDLPKWMGEEKRLVDSEYAGATLGDQRLNSRLQKIAGTLEANPEVGFPHAMTEAELEAFYRFLSNDRIEPDSILAPHVQATLGRCEGQDTVLCVHDTTVFRFKTPREGLGEYAGRTLFGHVSMAVGSDGVPLGVVGLHPWARGKDTVTQRKHRGELTYHRSVGLPNEQDRWISLVDQVESILDRARVLHVMDSEADEPTRMREFVSSCPVVCTRSVPLSKRQKTRSIRPNRSWRWWTVTDIDGKSKSYSRRSSTSPKAFSLPKNAINHEPRGQ